jgi:LPS export ABC transporter protein LptC
MVMMAIVLFLFSCGSKDKVHPSFPDRSMMPVLRVTDVVTMISDSGITRYRISAPEWLVYDKAEDPFWDFPKGAVFERFDNEYRTDASIRADSVVYYSQRKMWRLSGNVQANNLKDEKFETDILFWNQETAKIYTDEKVTITQTDKVLVGYGFESDQTMDKYTLKNVSAIIPIEKVE